MFTSILESVKDFVGVNNTDVFDNALIIDINNALGGLTQIGVGPEDGYVISGKDETWSDFVGDTKRIGLIQTYVCGKVKLAFDPPASQTIVQALTESVKEAEWRLND